MSRHWYSLLYMCILGPIEEIHYKYYKHVVSLIFLYSLRIVSAFAFLFAKRYT